MSRRRLEDEPPAPTSSVSFVPSGSYLLDKCLGGGWARGRIANIVGDESTGKTLLTIEAAANFAMIVGASATRYAETEHAFDEIYARGIGFPIGISRTEDGELETVEQLEIDILKFVRGQNGVGCFYALDSLDAISSAAEMGRNIGEATFAMERPKLLSEFFRKHKGELERRGCTFIVVSQTRDKIGVTFGQTKTRSGGRALNFYASQIVWLSQLGKIKRTVRGIERVVGVEIRVNCTKNKVGMAHRQVDLTMPFAYGVDDEISMLNWLRKNKALDVLPVSEKEAKNDIQEARETRDRAALRQINDVLRRAVQQRWDEIEADLAPRMSKYGD